MSWPCPWDSGPPPAGRGVAAGAPVFLPASSGPLLGGMTNSQPHPQPSPKQLRFHRDLVERTGAGFPAPKTAAQARRQIRAMLALTREGGADRLRERHAIRIDFEEQSGGAVRVRDEELSGYGSTASWRRTA